MTGNNQMNQDQDRLRQQQDQGRQDRQADTGLGVQGEDRSFGAKGRTDDERSQATSATCSTRPSIMACSSSRTTLLGGSRPAPSAGCSASCASTESG